MVHLAIWSNVQMSILKKFRQNPPMRKKKAQPIRTGQYGEHVYRRGQVVKTSFGYSYVCPCGKTVKFKNMPSDDNLASACGNKCNEVLKIGNSRTVFTYRI
jgi:hypothetical protein